MIELTGTPKQIEYATDIRERLINAMLVLAEGIDFYKKDKTEQDAIKATSEGSRFLDTVSAAKTTCVIFTRYDFTGRSSTIRKENLEIKRSGGLATDLKNLQAAPLEELLAEAGKVIQEKDSSKWWIEHQPK